jgi:hypothetical protein
MAIAYIEKGGGLHEAIAQAGLLLMERDGVWVAGPGQEEGVQAIVNAFDLDDAKDWMCARVARHARDLRQQVIADYSAGEMASWPIKVAQAAKYRSSGMSADAPMLLTEAIKRGISVLALVQKVEQNAAAFSDLEAQFAGVDGMHRDAIRAKTTFAAVCGYNYLTGWPVT